MNTVAALGRAQPLCTPGPSGSATGAPWCAESEEEISNQMSGRRGKPAGWGHSPHPQLRRHRVPGGRAESDAVPGWAQHLSPCGPSQSAAKRREAFFFFPTFFLEQKAENSIYKNPTPTSLRNLGTRLATTLN